MARSRVFSGWCATTTSAGSSHVSNRGVRCPRTARLSSGLRSKLRRAGRVSAGDPPSDRANRNRRRQRRNSGGVRPSRTRLRGLPLRNRAHQADRADLETRSSSTAAISGLKAPPPILTTPRLENTRSAWHARDGPTVCHGCATSPAQRNSTVIFSRRPRSGQSGRRWWRNFRRWPHTRSRCRRPSTLITRA